MLTKPSIRLLVKQMYIRFAGLILTGIDVKSVENLRNLVVEIHLLN